MVNHDSRGGGNRRSLLAIGFFLGAVSVACGGLSAVRSGGATAAPFAQDAYYYQGKLVPLRRSETQLVVGLEARAVLPYAIDRQFVVSGRRFVVVIVGNSSQPRPEDLLQAIRTLRADDRAWFVAPVYLSIAGGHRLFPTDELIVRVRSSDNVETLRSVPPQGLRLERRVRDSADQFVLRLAEPKVQNPVDVARRLFEEGRFLWVEPNFVQDRS